MAKRFIVLFDGYPQGRFETHEEASDFSRNFFIGSLPAQNKQTGKLVEIVSLISTFTHDGEEKSVTT